MRALTIRHPYSYAIIQWPKCVQRAQKIGLSEVEA